MIALALIVLAGAAGFDTYKTWFADETGSSGAQVDGLCPHQHQGVEMGL